MAGDLWRWWTDSLAIRIAAGGAVFAALLAWDLWRRGRAGRRWREYLFLLAATATAILYGIANDQVTATVSWEYFYYGKGLSERLGGAVPPDGAALRLAAVLVGVQATWAAGLLAGVAVLMVNNPRKGRPPLPFARLYRLLPRVALAAAVGGALVGLVGYAGWLTGLSGDFVELVREDLFRPRRFMCVWGVHLGGYLGGLVGTAAAVTAVVRGRRRLVASASG